MNAAIKQCESLQVGRVIHKHAVLTDRDTDPCVATVLITMYSKFNSMQRARDVFENIPKPDAILWTCLIQGCVENRQYSLALDLYASMDCEPDSVTFIAFIRACSALADSGKESHRHECLEKGTAVHKRLRELGLESNVLVATTLVDMYSKCGNMSAAQHVFDNISHRTVVSWNCLILGYAHNGMSSLALEVFMLMDCEPNSVTFIAALKACSCLASGMEIHRRVEELKFDSDARVATTLLDMYRRCGCMSRARVVFDAMRRKTVVSWSCLILGYAELGESSTALKLFERMDCEPDSGTFVAALKACGNAARESQTGEEFWLEKGIDVHEKARVRGFESEMLVANALLDMYCNCGCMLNARKVFNKMESHDAASWTRLMLGYVDSGEASVALDLFRGMDCQPDSITFVAALKACGNSAALRTGQRIHAEVCKLGLEQDQVVANSLVDLYGKCGSSARAHESFNAMHSRDMVSWTALVSGSSSSGDTSLVFQLVREMEEAGLKPDGVTFTSALAACSHAGKVDEGKMYFRAMHRYGISPGTEHFNCMVDMLGRANRLQEALSLVYTMGVETNRVTWMSLLSSNLVYSKAYPRAYPFSIKLS